MTPMSNSEKVDSRVRLPRDERRALLLNAALEVFTVSGYHAAAMDEIADRAGVSKPVLYQHFPSKLDLYLALLDVHIDSLVFAIQKAIASNKENKNRVKATRLDRMTYDCAVAVSAVISLDTGFPKEESMVLAIGLIGCAQITARHWLERDGKINRSEATSLVTNLLWRGISGFPLQS